MRLAIRLGTLLALLQMTAGCGDDDASTSCASVRDCRAGEACVDGSCQPETPRPDGGPGSDGGALDGSTCPSPRMICGGECVDVLRNPDHCGACDALCIAPASCAAGMCITPCTPADPPVEICNGVDDDCDGEIDPPDCATGLLAWYRFEQTEGPVLDSSGNGLHGEAMGALVRGTVGHDGSGISLDGTATTMVRIPDGPSTTFGSAFSVEAWVSPLDCAHGASNHNTAVAKEGEFLLAFNTSCGVANYINNGAWVGDFPSTTVSQLSWTHYAVTYDGTTIRSYVAGRAAGMGTAQSGPIPDTAADLFIGARPDCCEQTLRGRIDEVKIWTVVRTPQEICAAAGRTWEDMSGTCG